MQLDLQSAENDHLGTDKSLPNPRYLFIDR